MKDHDIRCDAKKGAECDLSGLLADLFLYRDRLRRKQIVSVLRFVTGYNLDGGVCAHIGSHIKFSKEAECVGMHLCDIAAKIYIQTAPYSIVMQYMNARKLLPCAVPIAAGLRSFGVPFKQRVC